MDRTLTQSQRRRRALSSTSKQENSLIYEAAKAFPSSLIS